MRAHICSEIRGREGQIKSFSSYRCMASTGKRHEGVVTGETKRARILGLAAFDVLTPLACLLFHASGTLSMLGSSGAWGIMSLGWSNEASPSVVDRYFSSDFDNQIKLTMVGPGNQYTSIETPAASSMASSNSVMLNRWVMETSRNNLPFSEVMQQPSPAAATKR
ncbi:hypothetical protein HD806DRAFT_530073 [Xylariaceae sp. AK1471]|nr:hypothetical protein HD806DRAFT_530073 [Xylariaceae sp. AK1471]